MSVPNNIINAASNVIMQSLHGTVMGPVMHSERYDEQCMCNMHILQWKVANGSRLVGALGFGIFADILPGNASYSTLVARVAPGYPDAVAFPQVCVNSQELNPNWTNATVCRQVVNLATTIAESGDSIFESEVVPLDGYHGLRTTVKTFTPFANKTFTKQREDTTPQRYLGNSIISETQETVNGTAASPTLVAGEVYSSEQQVSFKTKEIIKRSLEVTNQDFTDKQAYVEGTVAEITSELINTAGADVDSGLLVISSELRELGNGKSERVTAEVASWPVVEGSVYDQEIQRTIKFTEQFVAPPSGGATVTDNPLVTFTPVNKDRYLKRTRVAPDLNSVGYTFPIKVNPVLPRVLKGVTVVWNTANQAGDQDSTWAYTASGPRISISCNLADTASGEASAIPEFLLDIEEYIFNDLPGTAHVFYLPLPVTEAAILAKIGLGAVRWPVFRPKAHTLVGLGKRISCSVNVSVSASGTQSSDTNIEEGGKSTSSNKSVSLTNVVVQIPPTIHGPITFTGDMTKALSFVTSATMNCSGGIIPTITATKSVVSTDTASVSPTFLPATAGQNTIPTSGVFLLDVKVRPYDFGYVQVYAETFNASVLA